MDKSGAVLPIWLFVIVTSDSAHSSGQSQKQSAGRIDYLTISDCNRAWELIWCDFLEGSPDASAAAVLFIMHRNLRIPRFPHDYSILVRDIAFFAFNSIGTAERMEHYVDVIIDMLHADYPGLRERQSIYGNLCSADSAPSRECLSRFEADDILPTAEDFVQEIRSAQDAGIAAFCAD